MSVRFDEKTFKALYPGAKTDAKGGSAIEFKSQDSEYRVYIPGKKSDKSTLHSESDGGLTVTLVLDHIIHATSHDDHSTTKLSFDNKGNLQEASHTLAIEDGKTYAVPKGLKYSIDAGIMLVGAVVAPETGTASLWLAAEVVGIVATVCEAFDMFMNFMDRLNDDGGRLNFPAEIGHTMVRTCSAVAP